jgi:hypothetical protein
MEIHRLAGIVERAFRRLWRRHIYDSMPPPPDPRRLLGLLQLGLPDPNPNDQIHPPSIDLSIKTMQLIAPSGEYICGCSWNGFSIPHYCPKHRWACPVFEIHGQPS